MTATMTLCFLFILGCVAVLAWLCLSLESRVEKLEELLHHLAREKWR